LEKNNYFVINGSRPLEGKVVCSGSKNICLAIMAGSILGKGITVLENVPCISDVNTMIKVIRSLGVKCEFISPGSLEIDATDITNTVTEYKYVEKMRASFNVLGPVLARCGRASVSRPGGCDIGERPVDCHIYGLKKLGASSIDETKNIEMTHNGLVGNSIMFDKESVGATQHIMMTACLAKGKTIILNANCEPEVTELATFLVKMGANISGIGTKQITIEGVEELRGIRYRIPFDRIEAGSFAVFAAITKGNIILEDVITGHMSAFLMKLKDCGVDVKDVGEHSIRFSCKERPKAIDLTTSIFPGFPTDMMPAFATLMSIADGTSVITENIFNNRFKFAAELQRMGAINKLNEDKKTCLITGVEQLTGAMVSAPDLRGGIALVTAALAAVGESSIDHIRYILRGYENLPEKLKNISADIKIIPKKRG